jgi:phage-related protein
MISVSKPVVWLHGEVQTPPFSTSARREAGFWIRDLQEGKNVTMPQARPMPSIGAQIHELRINDEARTWRIIYRVDDDAIVVAEVFSKKTPRTPASVIKNCKRRYRDYDAEK